MATESAHTSLQITNMVGLSVNSVLTMFFTYRVWHLFKNSFMISNNLKIFLSIYNVMLIIISISGFFPGDYEHYLLSAAKVYFMTVYFTIIYQMMKLKIVVE
jgi:hypothetical protein